MFSTLSNLTILIPVLTDTPIWLWAMTGLNPGILFYTFTSLFHGHCVSYCALILASYHWIDIKCTALARIFTTRKCCRFVPSIQQLVYVWQWIDVLWRWWLLDESIILRRIFIYLFEIKWQHIEKYKHRIQKLDMW